MCWSNARPLSYIYTVCYPPKMSNLFCTCTSNEYFLVEDCYSERVPYDWNAPRCEVLAAETKRLSPAPDRATDCVACREECSTVNASFTQKEKWYRTQRGQSTYFVCASSTIHSAPGVFLASVRPACGSSSYCPFSCGSPKRAHFRRGNSSSPSKKCYFCFYYVLILLPCCCMHPDTPDTRLILGVLYTGVSHLCTIISFPSRTLPYVCMIAVY